MDTKDLELAITNPTEFLSKSQSKGHDWDLSVEDIARSINYNPYEALLTKAQLEPEKYNWVERFFSTASQTTGDMIGSASRSLLQSTILSQDIPSITYSSPNMTREDADRLTEDVIYARNYIYKARQEEMLPIYQQGQTSAELGSAIGSFITFALGEAISPAVSSALMFGSSYGEMQESLADKYITDKGSIEGYADRKDIDNALSLGFAAFNTFIERALGAEKSLGKFFREPAQYGKLDWFFKRQRLGEFLGKKVLTREALSQAGKQITKQGFGEFSEEFLQQYLGTATEITAGYGQWSDLLSDEELKSALKAGMYGGILGGVAGGTMYYTARNKIKNRLAKWAEEHNIELNDNQLTNTTNMLLTDGGQKALKEIQTRGELKSHHGPAFEKLVEKVKDLIVNTGKELPDGFDLDKFARDTAATIEIPAVNLSNWLDIPTETFLNVADLQVVNGMWILKPIRNSQDVKNMIAERNAIIKEQNALKKLGTENTAKLEKAQLQKKELQALYNSMVQQETIALNRSTGKKAKSDFITAKDLLPEQTAKIDSVVEADETQSYVLFAGKRVPIEYEVVDLSEIQPSHINGEKNPNYKNVELQNRASRGNVIDVADLKAKAENFTPERVLIAPTSAEGAPVVNADGEVIAGNGRAEIVRQVYENNKSGAEEYKKQLKKLGYKIDGIEKPILVRRNTTMSIEEQVAAADISNISETSAFDEASQAKRDSQFLKGAENDIDFASKIPMSDRRGLMQANGRWNKSLLKRRYANALLSWLCGNDTQLFEALVLDGVLPQRIIDSLVANGKAIYDLQEKYPDLELRKDIYGALVKLQRTTKGNFLQVMQEQELDGRDVMPENVVLWGMIFANSATFNNMLKSYAELGMANRDAVNSGEDMFGEKVAPLSKKDLYAQALQRADNANILIAESNNKEYTPLFTETGEITDINLQSAFMSYQNQFNSVSSDTLTQPDLQEQFDLADENARLDDKYPEYKGETIEVDGKERSVFNSNGDRIAKSKEALTNFWKWFGDSKVVNEQGRPLVVYHGTGFRFEEFDNVFGRRGIYFTDSKIVASSYQGVNGGRETITMPVYVKVGNPFVIDFDGSNYVDVPQIVENYKFEDLDDVVSWAKKKGYDGVIAKNIKDPSSTSASWEAMRTIANDYVAFEPTQIKSVDNRGTYSDKTGNIYWQQTNKLPNAWYDPELQIIALTRKWNELSLIHEMQHHYLNVLINLYAQNQGGQGTLTEEKANIIRELFRSLGVDNIMTMTPTQLQVAQERFASMTEAYLTGLGADVKDDVAYKVFFDWVPEKYKSILNIGYLDEQGKVKNPILDQSAIDFFNKWYSNQELPTLPTSPKTQSNINPTDENGEVIPSSQREMNNREIENGVDADEQIQADKDLYREIDQNVPTNLRSGMDGAQVEISNMVAPDEVSMPNKKRDRWFKTGVNKAQERMANMARDYVAKNQEHAKELALADPEISTTYDAPIDRAWLIRAVMETTDKNSPEYAIMYDNLAVVRSMSGSTLGLTNDMSQKAYLDAKREIESARELKAIYNYAGNGSGAVEKWNTDIRNFINSNLQKIMATDANSEERKIAIKSFLEEAKTKFSANTTDVVLNQLDLTGVNTRDSGVFVKWAEKAIKQASGINLSEKEKAEVMDASYSAQNAMLSLDNPDIKISSKAAQEIRNWEIKKDELKKANFGRFDKLNNAINTIGGGYIPSAMLMSFNTLFVANIPSTAINTAVVRSSAQAIYGKNLVDESILENEKKRIQAVYKASGMNLAQMEKPTSPTYMHGEKYMGSEKSKWYDFTFKTLSYGDNLFRIPTFVDVLGRIASKNSGGDAKKATELFRQYCQLNNNDESVKLARKEAVAVANMAVFTQNGILSSSLNHIRSYINKMSRGLIGLEPDGFGLGNILAPFLKTGANVIEMGITGTIAPVRTLAMALRKANGKEITDLQKVALRNDWKYFGWTAVLVGLLSMLTSDDDEFYREPYKQGMKYDPNKPYDSINIGGAWVKLDIFGPFEVPIRTACMMIKKWKADNSIGAVASGFGGGLVESFSNVPLLSEAFDSNLSYLTNQPGKWASSFVYNQAMKAVPAQAKSVSKVLSREIGVELDTDILGKTVSRKFHRNYGFDGIEPTTNDWINILTNRLKFID